MLHNCALQARGGGGWNRLECDLECMIAHFDVRLDWVSDIEAINHPLCL